MVEGVRVLIAEDDEAVRYLIRLNLELAGHDVVGEAESGSEALAQLASTKTDVLVLDMMMPGMNGREVLSQLADAIDISIPMIIAFSAAPTELDRAMELGANAAILKTGDFDILVDALAVL